jgi:preprotein translocase subunit SecE
MSVTSYFKEVRAEMKHVSWPSRRQAAMYTAVVIGVSLAVAIYLGVLDYLFAFVIQKII